jgi:magnesium chelatase family protein
VAAMNPCRCGHLGDASRECSKAPRCGEDYLNRISGPLLDRIDMTVQVQPVPTVELSRAPAGEPSAAVAARVAEARDVQRRRGALNAETDAALIELHPEARLLAEEAAEKMRLSARGFTRVLRVARTIADLARSPVVRRHDVLEALSYRHRIPGRR